MLVIWEWGFPDSADEEIDIDSVCSAEGDDSETCGSNDEETDTVVFKCIGVTKDPLYQDTLGKAAAILAEGGEVPVRITPEPTIPFDAHAVSFECNVESRWKVIGYVVKELCVDVQEALLVNSILSVKFEWIKYKVMPEVVLVATQPLLSLEEENGQGMFIASEEQCTKLIQLMLWIYMIVLYVTQYL